MWASSLVRSRLYIVPVVALLVTALVSSTQQTPSRLGAYGGSVTTMVSVASDGTQGIGNPLSPVISADGRYVAFSANDRNLVAGDTNNHTDVFLHDTQTGETTRVSVASDGSQSNGESESPTISADGRYVAFWSVATNFVPADTELSEDVFVHDRQTGQTTRISVASDGSQANGASGGPSISGDGRYVAFWSMATNLVSGDTNGVRDVFVRDRLTGQASRISVASDGSEANDQSAMGAPEHPLAISSDGRFVAFTSSATNLVPEDTNGHMDIFVHELQTGQTTRVSVASDGCEANNSSSSPSISSDGRYVAFDSSAKNLVPGDTTKLIVQVFVHDRQTRQTTRVSLSSNATPGNSDSHLPAISADARYVAFQSIADNLVPGDINSPYDVFVHDRQTGWTSRVSIASDGTESNATARGGNKTPAISGDGRFVAFRSDASNLVPGDTSFFQIYVHDRGPNPLTVLHMPLVIQATSPGW